MTCYVRSWQFCEGADSEPYLVVIDEYGFSFQLRLTLHDVDGVVSALSDYSDKRHKTLATIRRPTIEADVAAAIDRIRRDRDQSPPSDPYPYENL
jgi:hypothetical protein